jgi:hypothetical protein
MAWPAVLFMSLINWEARYGNLVQQLFIQMHVSVMQIFIRTYLSSSIIGFI